MDFNLTKKNLQTWAADRMELDKATKHYDLDIFIMVEDETGDEYNKNTTNVAEGCRVSSGELITAAWYNSCIIML